MGGYFDSYGFYFNEFGKQPYEVSEKTKNSENQQSSEESADMRIRQLFGQKKCDLELTSRDVILVPDLFSDRPDIYHELLA